VQIGRSSTFGFSPFLLFPFIFFNFYILYKNNSKNFFNFFTNLIKNTKIKQKQNLSCFFSSPRPFYYAIL